MQIVRKSKFKKKTNFLSSLSRWPFRKDRTRRNILAYKTFDRAINPVALRKPICKRLVVLRIMTTRTIWIRMGYYHILTVYFIVIKNRMTRASRTRREPTNIWKTTQTPKCYQSNPTRNRISRVIKNRFETLHRQRDNLRRASTPATARRSIGFLKIFFLHIIWTRLSTV